MDRKGCVAVTGATGFVGRHVVAHLLEHGYRVRALARSRAKAAQVLGQHEGLELVFGDVLERSDCETLTLEADACVHLVGIIREQGRQTFERMHVTATRHMVRACEHRGVARYVHMSALGATPFGPAAYQRTKFAAEQVVRASRLDWTILRPGLIHGPEGDFMHMAAAWARGRKPPYIFMPYFTRIEEIEGRRCRVIPQVAPISVDDVARAVLAAFERDESIGEIYPLAGSETLNWPELLTSVRDALPTRGPKLNAVGLPGSLVAMKVRVATMLGLGALLPIDEGMVLMGQRDATADNTKATIHLGLRPAGFREKLHTYSASL